MILKTTPSERERLTSIRKQLGEMGVSSAHIDFAIRLSDEDLKIYNLLKLLIDKNNPEKLETLADLIASIKDYSVDYDDIKKQILKSEGLEISHPYLIYLLDTLAKGIYSEQRYLKLEAAVKHWDDTCEGIVYDRPDLARRNLLKIAGVLRPYTAVKNNKEIYSTAFKQAVDILKPLIAEFENKGKTQ